MGYNFDYLIANEVEVVHLLDAFKVMGLPYHDRIGSEGTINTWINI